ncbi:hypothetical protein ACFQX6_01755 [Streptosporangium lutulentum]
MAAEMRAAARPVADPSGELSFGRAFGAAEAMIVTLPTNLS